MRCNNKHLNKMPMKYYLPTEPQPSEQTLQSIRQFARHYKATVNPAWLLSCVTFGIA